MSVTDRALEARLSAATPASVLTLGVFAGNLVRGALASSRTDARDRTGPQATKIDSFDWPVPYCAQAGRDLIRAISENDLRYELAVVSLELPPLGAEAPIDPVLAHLRDVRASLVWVALARSGQQPPTPHLDLTALGFTPEPSSGETGPVALFVHDVATYKRTPSWLNARGWAHPELWNRYRW